MRFTRRLFIAGTLAAPFVTGRAASASEDTQGPVRNNISAFRTHEWQDHFDTLGVGIIISDTTAKVLQAVGRADPPGLHRGSREES